VKQLRLLDVSRCFYLSKGLLVPPVVPHLTGLESQEDDEFSTVLEALGTDSDGHVQVWRYQTSTEPHGFAMIARIPIGDFDPWTIGEKYGGGRYRFDIRNSRGKYVKKGVERMISSPPRPATPSPALLPNFDPVAMILKRAESADSFNQALMLALIQNLGRVPVAAPAVASGLTATDFVAIMREARESATPAAPPHEAMLALLREGIGFGREIEGTDGDGAGGGGAMAVLPKILDVLSRVLPPAGAAAPELRPATGAAPDGHLAIAALPGPRVQETEDPVRTLLARFTPQIIAAVQAGQDPMDFARAVVSAIPPGSPMIAFRNLVFASPAQRLAAFQAGAPELVPCASWIDRVSGAARGLLAPRSPLPFPSPIVPAVAPETLAAPDAEEDDSPDELGCDLEECENRDCVDPDHFLGCDDEVCRDSHCCDPEHFTDEASKQAATRRAELGR